MAKRFTRRRWRRPERMLLDHAPVERRKDLGASEPLPLEPELARRTSHRRRNVLLAVFFVSCAAQGAVIGLFVVRSSILGAAFVVYGALYLVLAREFGDEWLRRAVGARDEAAARLVRLTTAECRTSGVGVPRVLVADGGTCNALALSLRKRTIVTTGSCESADELELEGVLAHEVVHLRDGEAALASLYFVLAGAPDITVRGGGVLCVLSVPLWPAAFVLRFARAIVLSPGREHRADIAAAMLTRYPPGIASALRVAGTSPSGLRITDPFWFVRRDGAGEREAEVRAGLVSEM
jgi:Zn-dependent protease with chaperone function